MFGAPRSIGTEAAITAGHDHHDQDDPDAFDGFRRSNHLAVDVGRPCPGRRRLLGAAAAQPDPEDVVTGTPDAPSARATATDPNIDRGFLLPTAMTQPAGSVTYNNYELLLHGITYGITDRVQVSVTVLSPIVEDMPFVGFAAVKGRIVSDRPLPPGAAGIARLGTRLQFERRRRQPLHRRRGRAGQLLPARDCSSLASASATYQLVMPTAPTPAHMVVYGGSIVHRVGRHVKLLGEVTSAAGGARDSGDLENLEGVLVGYGVRFHTNAIAADVGFLKPIVPTGATMTCCWACRSPACRTAGSNRPTRTNLATYPSAGGADRRRRPYHLVAVTTANASIADQRGGFRRRAVRARAARRARAAGGRGVRAHAARRRVSGRIRKDGADATVRIAELVRGSQFDGHIRAVLLGGIAVGGFNVIDIHALAAELARPVLVVARRLPRLALIRAALEKLPRGAGKWRLIEQAGAMEPVGNVFVQRAGLDIAEARALLAATTLHGNMPEPLRLAHLIAGGIVTGKSRGRA